MTNMTPITTRTPYQTIYSTYNTCINTTDWTSSGPLATPQTQREASFRTEEYRGRRHVQIIECKYSIDGNIQELIDHTYQLYEPLKGALQMLGSLKADSIIIPIVISRTCTFNVKTLAEIAQLVSYKEEQPEPYVWDSGNPLTTSNHSTLQEQIHTITFPDGSHIQYLPPNKSYKILGVHINTVLDFREHHTYINKEERKMASALSNRKLIPTYTTLVVEQLLKSKYRAVHLGVFNDRQLTAIDGILNNAMRQVICLLPSFSTKGVQRPLKEAGLGLVPIRDRATQWG